MTQKNSLFLLLCLGVFLMCGCGSGDIKDSKPDKPQKPKTSSVPQKPFTPEGKPGHGTIVELQVGDAACYLSLATQLGEMWERAELPFCEDPTLSGQTVVFQWQEKEVVAEICEGNPDCQETEMAWIIVGLTPVGGGPPPLPDRVPGSLP